VTSQQISAAPAGGAAKATRYQQLSKPANPTVGQGSFENTQRSKAILVPPESDLNRYEQAKGGAGSIGQNEELAQNLEKIVSQLGLISNSLLLLEQRISVNEEQVGQVLEYFREIRDQN